jgi:ferrous iron transport protein A
MNEVVKLPDLAPGEEAVIVRFEQEGAEMTRLRDLGLSDGASLRLIKFAPFGDPMEIKIRGFHLSLEKSIAQSIMVAKKEAQS